MPLHRPRRAALYLPASNVRAIDKARTLAADMVILDCEDAVAPAQKDTARAQSVEAIAAGGFGRRELLIRVNAPGMPWFEADLAAAARSGCDGILLPKVDAAATLREASRRLEALGAAERTRIWAMIETPLAILDAGSIAASAREPGSRLAGFVMGANDLARETGTRLVPGRAPLVPWLMTALAAARAHGLAILDSVFNDVRDVAGLEAEAMQGRDMGFDGKTVIHPAQIEPVNRAFSPSEAELARARAIVEAFARPENAGKGAIALDGAMVETLHVEMARRLIAFDAALRS